MRSARGFSLIETLIATASLMIFFAAVSAMVDMSLKIMGRARAESVAASIGQSRVELANNLPYEDLGTIGGIPPGLLPATEIEIVGSNEYEIKTNVVYVDDPFDGVAPTDLVPIDYKRVRVEVDWSGPFAPRRPLVFWNDVAPKGLEQLEDAGTISLLVFDADGAPIQGAEVSIKADDVSPPVDITTTTDAVGRVLLPGAAECVECYEISVTKEGYTTDRTYGVEEVTNPSPSHVSVFEGEVAEPTFNIDKTSTLIVRTTRSPSWGYQPYGNIGMRIYGTKEIGRDELDTPIYKVDMVVNTGPSGEVSLDDMEWDTYQVELSQGASLDVTGSWHLTPISMRPDVTKVFTAVLGNNSVHSLRVAAILDENTPIGGVAVNVKHEGLSYDATQLVADVDKPDRGQVFFPNLTTSQEPYMITLTLEGYDEASGSATVSGDLVEVFTMSPVEEE